MGYSGLKISPDEALWFTYFRHAFCMMHNHSLFYGEDMKGIIFTELFGFIEEVAGVTFAEQVLEEAALPNGGVFTAVGTYPAAYALALITKASELSDIPAAKLCADYGEWLFGRFTVLYPQLIDKYAGSEEMLDHVGSHIHEEVTILYPDAKPPEVRMKRDGDVPVILYESHRPLSHIALGLIRGCLKHYGDPREVAWTPGEDLSKASFRIVEKA